MDSQTRDIIYKYKNNKNISIYSNKHFINSKSILAKIKSKEDIEIHRTITVCLINYYAKADFDLFDDNIIQIEKSIGIFELAVQKALKYYGYGFYDFNYSLQELQQLIKSIFDVYDLFTEVRLKKLCQV